MFLSQCLELFIWQKERRTICENGGFSKNGNDKSQKAGLIPFAEDLRLCVKRQALVFAKLNFRLITPENFYLSNY